MAVDLLLLFLSSYYPQTLNAASFHKAAEIADPNRRDEVVDSFCDFVSLMLEINPANRPPATELINHEFLRLRF